MKKRFLGLLALALCLMMTLAPVCGAMAEGSITYAEREKPVNVGDLICSDKSVVIQNSGSTNYHYYYPNKGNYSYTLGIDFNYDDENTKNLHVVGNVKLATSSPKYWRAFSADPLHLEPVFPFSEQDITIDNEAYKLILSEGLDGMEYGEEGLQGMKNSLLKEAQLKLPAGFKFFYFEGSLYRPLDDSNGAVLKHKSVNQSITFTIPQRDTLRGDNVVVLHGNFTEENNTKKYAVTPVETTVNPDGSLTVTVDGLSPFMVAWTEGNPPADAGTPPTTGDNASLALWFALAVLSLTGMIVIKRRKHA